MALQKDGTFLFRIVPMNNEQNGSVTHLPTIQPVTIDTMLNTNGSFSFFQKRLPFHYFAVVRCKLSLTSWFVGHCFVLFDVNCSKQVSVYYEQAHLVVKKGLNQKLFLSLALK